MRSALLCVFFTLIVQRGSRADNDFRPMPIPLEWQYEKREALHEAIITDEPPTVAAVPVHYWEDALRHSVYLTLVRDKIDQLIAKGEASKPDQQASKEIDDHDLWEKIKTAPFDGKEDDDPESLNDVTIMAKGRLVEGKGGFRFKEDERSKEKCGDEKCMEGIKALWSVKRMRHQETSPGKYHYELTFSVISQPPKKQRKPYETPVRTFTVRETVPERVVDMPQEHRSYERVQVLSTHRPERALWFHKNIVPTQHYQARQYHHGLDRIFSSLFSDDDDYDTPQRYRPNPYVPPVQTQYSKVGYVGSPSDQQKRLTPYPYKPHSYKYSRPPLSPPPYSHMQQHHYVETEAHGPVNNQFTSQTDYRFITPNKLVKTTRPAVLPTPYTPAQPPRNWTADGDKKKSNTTDNTTKAPEVVTGYKSYSKPRPAPMKINYLPDHVRPPIYNAPPGVFVTMDKKPFKPMPPLKLVYSSKFHKSSKPIDFKPSPQVLDMKQFSEPDPLFDTAFRPITWNYSDVNTTEKIEAAESSTQINNTRKSNTKGKKPPKKHENIKSERVTSTTTPEIITASGDSEEENDAFEWVNVVGAFTKTTPMVSQKGKVVEPATSTPEPISTTVSTTTVKRRTSTTTEAIEEPTTTTSKPRKRTRPPPKFTNSTEKIKKHKRRTTTTTKAPEVKTTQDLTPQASSAAAIKPAWNTTTKSVSTMSLTTTTSTSSTTATTKPTTTTTKATTTTQVPYTSTEAKSTAATTQLKAKNRFRQSTLITKGTSVKHDKWSAISTTSATNVEKPRIVLPLSNKNSRRKGSNFQGYISSTPNSETDGDEINVNHSSALRTSSTTENIYKPASTSTHHYEETADQYESNDETEDYPNNQEDDSNEDVEQESDEQESKDHTEYIFQSSATTLSDKTNEIIEQYEPITEEIITSSYSEPKNKTKCKKKKHNATTTEEVPSETENPTTTTTSTASPSIFEELFGSFTRDQNTEKNETKSTSKPELVEEQSENHSKFVKIDDDLQDFLDSLDKGQDHSDETGEYDDDDEEQEPSIDNNDSPFNNEDENASARDSPDSYDYQERPYSLLELMAME